MSLWLALMVSAGPCATCHAKQTEAFEGSRHARSARLEVFRLPLTAGAPKRWCLSCHRPEGAGQGLTCDSCHPASSQHPDVKLGVKNCATCHEFNTPLPGHFDPLVSSDQPLQKTVSEFAGSSCASCHDVHRNDGAHDAAMLKRAVTVTATRHEDVLEVRVKVGITGHRFPTGDPFRRLLIESCEDAGCTRVLARRQFSRSFGMLDGGVWGAVRDTTLASGELVTFTLPAGEGWRAQYRFGDPAFEAQLPDAEVFVELAHEL
jgi:Cytochrome c3